MKTLLLLTCLCSANDKPFLLDNWIPQTASQEQVADEPNYDLVRIHELTQEDEPLDGRREVTVYFDCVPCIQGLLENYKLVSIDIAFRWRFGIPEHLKNFQKGSLPLIYFKRGNDYRVINERDFSTVEDIKFLRERVFYEPVSGISTRSGTSQTTNQPTVGYPVRGNWWTLNGGYPSREVMIAHLQSGVHAGKFDINWLRTLTYQQLHSLHSDDHERRVKRVASHQRQQRSYCPTCPR